MKNLWIGAALILVGAAILLERTGVLDIGWKVVFWGIVAVGGAVKLYDGFTRNRRGAIFGGTGFLILGVACLLDKLDVIYLDGPAAFALLLLAVGIAFLLMLVKSPRDWHLAVPGICFLAIGGAMFAGEIGIFPYVWEFRDIIRHYWPVVLILFGASLLLNRRAA